MLKRLIKRRSYLYVLDADRRVIPTRDVMEWGQFTENATNCIVGRTQITSEVTVSTVFIGIDHGFREGPPIVFETMIFGGPEDINDWTWRYSSWDDAEIGHKAAVRKARAALKQKVRDG